MTKYAIFDTETTGLFVFKDANGVPVPADDPSQPRLAHFSAILLGDDVEREVVVDHYVKPDGWSMTADAAKVNGLTTEFLRQNGVPIATVLDAYEAIVDEGYTLVAFNAQFDLKMMRGELRRAGRDDLFDRTPNICVMRAAMKLGVEKAGGGRGYPKLTDCARHLGFEFEAHTAGGDARAALALFRHLHAIGGLPEAKVHYAKVPPAHAKAPALAPGLGDLTSSTSIPEKF